MAGHDAAVVGDVGRVPAGTRVHGVGLVVPVGHGGHPREVLERVDDRCDLGKWIHTAGRAKLGAFPGFTALQGHHKMFHYAASNVVALTQAGKTDEARKMLDVQFAQHSNEVVRDLKMLNVLASEGKLDTRH